MGKQTAWDERLRMSAMPEASIGAITVALTEMNREGGFLLSTLLDPLGTPLVSVTASGREPELKDAVVSLVRRAALQLYGQMGPARMDEITLHDPSGRRLICRPLNIGADIWILAVLIPEKTMTYRRLMSQAGQAIRRALGG